jgi:hypothetical protein
LNESGKENEEDVSKKRIAAVGRDYGHRNGDDAMTTTAVWETFKAEGENVVEKVNRRRLPFLVEPHDRVGGGDLLIGGGSEPAPQDRLDLLSVQHTSL